MTKHSPLAGGADLLALAERCEQATGPDGFLDRHIAAALGLLTENAIGQPLFIGKSKRGSFSVPRYTASLDAAMTMVPEGWSVNLFIASKFKSTRCTLAGNGETVDAAEQAEAIAIAPALALCAAALRARAAQ